MTTSTGGGSDSDMVPIVRTIGHREVYEAWQGALEALSSSFFHDEACQLRRLFTRYTGFFIEEYMDGEIKIYALRPGVSEILNRIRIGTRKFGGAAEVRTAVGALFEISWNQGRLNKLWLN